jgi:D-xylulose reductase
MVTALAALAGGCSQVIMTDVQQPKLDLAATLGPITPINVAKQNLTEVVNRDDRRLGRQPGLRVQRQ